MITKLNPITQSARRIFFMLSFLIVLMLAAIDPISAQTATPIPSPTKIPTITSTPTQTEIVKVTLWHSWLGLDAQLLNTWIADFEAANPSVQITAQYISGDLQAQFVAGVRTEHGPDMFIGASTWAGSLADAQLILPLSARIDKTLHAQVTDLSWQNVTYNSAIYGIPESNQGIALYYNAALTSDAAPTLDRLLTQPGTITYDFYDTAGIYLGLGGKLISDNGSNLIEANGALSDYLALLKASYTTANQTATPPPNNRVPVSTGDAFRLGQSPYLIEGSWSLADLQEYLGADLRVVPLPTLKNGNVWTPLVNSQTFYLSATANNPDAAFQFMAYITSADAQAKAAKQARQIPVNPGTQIDDPLIAGFMKQFVAGTSTPPQTALASYWQILDRAVFDVTLGAKPVDTTAKNMVQRLDALFVTVTPTP